MSGTRLIIINGGFVIKDPINHYKGVFNLYKLLSPVN
jgi:hypothetical protein